MWAFPERELGGAHLGDVASATSKVALGIAESLGLACAGEVVRLPECRHRFTHLDAVYVPWSIEVSGEPAEGAWIDPVDTSGHALPVAQRKVMESWSHRTTTELA
jgi:hypothetical protein